MSDVPDLSDQKTRKIDELCTAANDVVALATEVAVLAQQARELVGDSYFEAPDNRQE